MEEALQIEKVLKSIFKNLSYKNLKDARQVNRKWNKFAKEELEKRSAAIHIDHDMYNIKKFYKLELLCKNKEIAAKIPLSFHVRAGGTASFGRVVGEKYDWRILKDLATYEPWKTRVTTLMLSDFWAADLNRLLPFLLSKLPNLTALNLSAVNNKHRVGKSVIPKDFVIPVVPKDQKFSVKSLTIFWYGAGGSRESAVVDPLVFARCPELKEFIIEINFVPYEVMGFFKRIQSLGEGCLTSLDHVLIRIQLDENDVNNPALMATLAMFVNRVKPTSLDFHNCEHFDPLIFFKYIKTEVRHLTIDVPSLEDSDYCTNWIVKSLRKFPILANLQQLQLHPNPRVTKKEEPTLPKDADFKHDLANVTTLQVSFDLKAAVDDDGFKRVLQVASKTLANVERVDFCNLYLNKFMGIMPRMEELTGIFKGLKSFSKLRKVSFQLVDFNGDLVERGWDLMREYGGKGIFADLSLLKGSTLEEFEVSVKLDYDLSVDSILAVFFAGYDPRIRLSLDFLPKTNGHVKLQLSKEDFQRALDDAEPDFNVKTPGHDGLSLGLPRYLKMTNYKPAITHRFR